VVGSIDGGRGAASYSINKAFLGGSVHGSHYLSLCFSVLGESERIDLFMVVCSVADLWQGVGKLR
jgi:hypothetical protein